MNPSGQRVDEPRALRVSGDPFALVEGAPVRELLWQAEQAGYGTSLWVAQPRGDRDGRVVPLNDGAVDCSVRTLVDEPELACVWRALAGAVPSTAPVVAWGGEDGVLRTALEWPQARAVLDGESCDASEQLARCAAVQANKWELPPGGLGIESFLDAPTDPEGDGRWVHPCGNDEGWGTSVLLRVLEARRCQGLADLHIALVWMDGESPSREWVARAEQSNLPWRKAEYSTVAAAGWILPWRRMMDSQLLLRALASGRPVVATRAGSMASLLGAEGLCVDVAAWLDTTNKGGELCLDQRSLAHALERVGDPSTDAELRCMGQRARVHVGTFHSARPRPLVEVPRGGAFAERPSGVLEAPLLETSSSSELTIETARALAARDNVDLQLVVRTPSTGTLEALRRRAPDLMGLVARNPRPCDLWLSAGWPARPSRPDARIHAVRFDWEYGAVPASRMGALSSADRIVVHSQAVADAVALAGLPDEAVVRIPHGVGREFSLPCEPLPDVARLRATLGPGGVVVLFVGGLVWRKGIDVWLRTLLALHARGVPVAGVVKSMGGASHYAGFHMGELVRKVQRSPSAPPLLHLERRMERGELAQLYRACDVLLHPYRGEGFGMPVAEAMVAGLPTVVTAGGSTDDFCAGPATARIASTRRPLDLPGVHMGEPWVLEPDGDDALRQVQAVLAQGPVGAVGRNPCSHGFSWDLAAQRLERLASDGTTGASSPSPLSSRSESGVRCFR